MPAVRFARLVAAILAAGFASAAAPADDWPPARTSVPETAAELKALEAEFKKVTDQVTPAVVALLLGTDGRGGAAGSGVVVSDDGLILTAAHVVGRPGSQMRVIFPDGTQAYAKTLGVHHRVGDKGPGPDTAMAQITSKVPPSATWAGAKQGKWPFVPVGKSGALRTGQWVLAMGHPGGPKQDRRPPVRVGRYLKYMPEEEAFRTDTVIVGGDSGGPLFDLTGKVVGIHTRIDLDATDHNLHVPTDTFAAEWDQLKAGKDLTVRVATAELGVTFDAEVDEPVVKEVKKNSAADAAGLKPGDLIVRLNGERMDAADDLIDAVAEMEPGRWIKLEVKRGDQIHVLKATLRKKSPSAPK